VPITRKQGVTDADLHSSGIMIPSCDRRDPTEFQGGAGENRTHGSRFADLTLSTWVPRQRGFVAWFRYRLANLQRECPLKKAQKIKAYSPAVFSAHEENAVGDDAQTQPELFIAADNNTGSGIGIDAYYCLSSPEN
jgi:hypothetical protein